MFEKKIDNPQKICVYRLMFYIKTLITRIKIREFNFSLDSGATKGVDFGSGFTAP